MLAVIPYVLEQGAKPTLNIMGLSEELSDNPQRHNSGPFLSEVSAQRVERITERTILLREQRTAGSNPVIPTIIFVVSHELSPIAVQVVGLCFLRFRSISG